MILSFVKKEWAFNPHELNAPPVSFLILTLTSNADFDRRYFRLLRPFMSCPGALNCW
jgi:hypothetical protein